MSRNHSIGSCLSGSETIAAAVYLVVQFLALPSFLHWCNRQFSGALTEAELNFVFYLINFMAMLLIFHDFLGRSGRQVTQHPGVFCEGVILGFVAYYACSWFVTWLISMLVPGFTNYNDEAIAAMGNSNAFLIFIGTVILVPPFEECMYRGLIFRSLYGKSRLAAYIVSILIFAIIHIIGYIGTYSPLELLMAFLQYLPAGLCLSWSYIRGDTIFAPIVIHALVNALAIYRLR